MVNGLSILETAFSMLEMAYEVDKRLKYVGNDGSMFEMVLLLEKRPKYVGNDVDL